MENKKNSWDIEAKLAIKKYGFKKWLKLNISEIKRWNRFIIVMSGRGWPMPKNWNDKNFEYMRQQHHADIWLNGINEQMYGK